MNLSFHVQEKERLIASKGNVEIPTMQDVASTMMSCTSHADIFPETSKDIQILLTLPVGTVIVERSFSQMKMIKTRLKSRLADCSLSRLMRIAIEGPELQAVHFNDKLNMYKEQIDAFFSRIEYFTIKVLYFPTHTIQTLLVININEFVPDAKITFH